MKQEILKSGYGDYIAIVTVDENNVPKDRVESFHKDKPTIGKSFDSEECKWYKTEFIWRGGDLVDCISYEPDGCLDMKFTCHIDDLANLNEFKFK